MEQDHYPFVILSSGLILYGALAKERKSRDKHWQTTALAGIFVLAYGGVDLSMQLFGGVLLTWSAYAGLLFVRSLLGGISVAMLFIAVLAYRAKTVLVISCVLLAAFNISEFAAYLALNRAPTARILLFGIAWFIGATITSAVFLWLGRRSGGDKQDDGGGLAATQSPAG